MERKLLYAFRGWIAFVAFMDLGTAFRSYIEKRSFLGDPSDSQYIAGKFEITKKKNIVFIILAFTANHPLFFAHFIAILSLCDKHA